MVLAFELIRCFVIKRLVDSFGIIKRFDVFADTQTGLIEVFEQFEFRPFVFQGPEEPFGNCVVITTARSTHRTRYVRQLQDLLKRIACVLASPVAVMDQFLRIGLT